MSEKQANTLPKRDEIDGKYKWKLEDIYTDNDAWEKDFEAVKALIPEISKYKGTLSKNPTTLYNCLQQCDKTVAINEKLFVYAKMKRDEDNSNSIYQALTDRATALNTDVYAAVSFIVPEILSMPEDKLMNFIGSSKDLFIYKQYIVEILRQKSHILSEREEELLALSSEISHVAKDVFTMFNNADIRFPFIKDEYGNEVEVTKGRYMTFLESKNRDVRKNAYLSIYSSYLSNKNTLATTLISNVKKNKFYASVRNYSSSLEASLDQDNITKDVYDTLIATINENLPILHRYLKLRKKQLGLEKLNMYDLFVPIVDQPKKNILYTDAINMVKEGILPLGEEYSSFLNEGFASGWVDVFENQGKTSGAYSWGSYKTHPYVLLNYQGTINDVFTLAHEMGHALHSYYTNKTQPYIYSEYKIFVAEVASTLNESLLMHYLLKKTTDKNERAYLLNHYLEEFRGTIFRQVMFAEFEKIIHSKVEAGEALTAETLCSIYRELNARYFGDEVILDSQIEVEWARIPHFYNSFYVYKYATGFSAAISLSSSIIKEGQPAVDRYLNFLKSGGSDYPLELLKKAGVDLSTAKPIQDALDQFAKALDELEELI